MVLVRIPYQFQDNSLRRSHNDIHQERPADAVARLTTDTERVVGRRALGGADEALTPAELDAVAKEVTGHSPEAVAARQIGGNAGLFRISSDASGNSLYNILVDRSLRC